MNIDSFILIGGRSSRFGADKPFVEIDGETLAARTARIVSRAFPEASIYFVAGFDGQFNNKLLDSLPHPVIYDTRPGHGAWSGLHTALSNAKSEWIFLTACDYPFITPELIELLAEQISNDLDVVAARQQDGRLQPLCAFYCVKAVFLAVEKMLTVGGSLPSLASFIDGVKTRIVDFGVYGDLENSDKFFVNINTSGDLLFLSP